MEPNDKIIIAIVALFVCLGLALAAWLGLRQLRFRATLRRAEEAFTGKDNKSAVKLFLSAERLWSIDIYGSKRQQIVKSLLCLRAIVDHINGLVESHDSVFEAANALRIIVQNLIVLFSDASNFRADDRMMVPEAAKNWGVASSALWEARVKFRETLDLKRG